MELQLGAPITGKFMEPSENRMYWACAFIMCGHLRSHTDEYYYEL